MLAGPAIFLIVGGLVKKTVIADELARRVVDPGYSDPAAHSASELTLAFYGFAAQIYCDFSGYTDMAIGLALLLGYQLLQNFNCPYLALSLQDFLAALAHDAFALAARLPLHPARRQPRRPAEDVPQPDAHDAPRRALARRAWTFVLWGGIHGTALSAERFARERFRGFRLPVAPGS